MILIVDDDADLRAYVRSCLRPLTERVLEAADGIAGLKAARAAAIDGIALIIADVVMPRMDGLELRDALAQDRTLADVPVLLVTGEPLSSKTGRLLRKPFNARSLQAHVRVLLGN